MSLSGVQVVELQETIDDIAGCLHAMALLKLADSPLVSDKSKETAVKTAMTILAMQPTSMV